MAYRIGHTDEQTLMKPFPAEDIAVQFLGLTK